jgi:hypothetical protein
MRGPDAKKVRIERKLRGAQTDADAKSGSRCATGG